MSSTSAKKALSIYNRDKGREIDKLMRQSEYAAEGIADKSQDIGLARTALSLAFMPLGPFASWAAGTVGGLFADWFGDDPSKLKIDPSEYKLLWNQAGLTNEDIYHALDALNDHGQYATEGLFKAYIAAGGFEMGEGFKNPLGDEMDWSTYGEGTFQKGVQDTAKQIGEKGVDWIQGDWASFKDAVAFDPTLGGRVPEGIEISAFGHGDKTSLFEWFDKDWEFTDIWEDWNLDSAGTSVDYESIVD